MCANFLDTASLSADDALVLLATAERFSHAPASASWDVLRGHVVSNLFYENSTRTRVSFETAAKKLGAQVVNVSAQASSVAKGESLRDTGLTLQATGTTVLVLRHPTPGAAHQMSRWLDIPVVNAGDGTHEHPTQAFLDVLTIQQRVQRVGRDLAGVHVGLVGDVARSRVARSNIDLLRTLGAQVTLVTPRAWMWPGMQEWPVPIVHTIESVLPELDVCMMLRTQAERGGDVPQVDPSAFRLTSERAAMLPEHAVVMHPGPFLRGVEISSAVVESDRSTIEQQVRNGTAVRMSVLCAALGKEVVL